MKRRPVETLAYWIVLGVACWFIFGGVLAAALKLAM